MTEFMSARKSGLLHRLTVAHSLALSFLVRVGSHDCPHHACIPTSLNLHKLGIHHPTYTHDIAFTLRTTMKRKCNDTAVHRTLETDSGRPDLQRFLAAFENLRQHDKAEALRYISSKQNDTASTSATNTVDVTTSAISKPVLDAHSCSVCKQLQLHKSSRRLRYESEELWFTRESLVHGLGRQCLLVCRCSL